MSSRKGSVRDRGTKRKSVPRNTRTAYHEAGHAVMASLMDIPFESISVMFGKDDDFEGCFQIHEGEEKRVEHLDPGEKRAIIEKYVMVALAGELSEFLLTGRHSMRDSLSDYLKAYKLVFDLCIPTERFDPDDRETELYIGWLSERCKNILKTPRTWRAVEALANELAQRKVMRAWEALEVIRDSMFGGDQDRAEAANRLNLYHPIHL